MASLQLFRLFRKPTTERTTSAQLVDRAFGVRNRQVLYILRTAMCLHLRIDQFPSFHFHSIRLCCGRGRHPPIARQVDRDVSTLLQAVPSSIAESSTTDSLSASDALPMVMLPPKRHSTQRKLHLCRRRNNEDKTHDDSHF